MSFRFSDLWNTAQLRARLAAHGLGQSEVFAWFLAVTGFDWLQFTAARLVVQPVVSEWSRIDAWATFGITLAGLLFLFLRNGGAHGQDFLYRYFPLSVAVGWKLVAILSLALPLLEFALADQPRAVRGWASVALVAACNVGLFLRIGHHLRRLARSTAAGTAPTVVSRARVTGF